MSEIAPFPPTRATALSRLAAFVSRAGQDYAQGRNSDLGPGHRDNVSLMSPYLRHRVITERDVVAAVLARHSFVAAEKFVQEVLWRTYWKGWLELRPSIWGRYIAELEGVQGNFRGARDLARATSGTTGIDGFDDWVRELLAIGYLHNHARMWFASIWIFTLRLPWTLGADFFMQHLVDADPASNTLSWRWVAGLQTAGKTYLATADNIARHTGGRFAPKGLATSATALTEAPIPPPSDVPFVAAPAPDCPALLLVTLEDLHPESGFGQLLAFAGVLLVAGAATGGDRSRAFVAGAAADAASRAGAHFNCPAQMIDAIDPATLCAAAAAAGVDTIVTAYAPVGPVADALAKATAVLQQSGVALVQVRRSWDVRFWPHARKGFSPLRRRSRRFWRKRGCAERHCQAMRHPLSDLVNVILSR